MTESALDILMESTDPPLIVVTTTAENELAGCLVGFHAQASISPQRYCIWLSKANHTYRTGLRAHHFAVHFLTEADLGLAEQFGTRSGDEVDKFEGLGVDLDESGVPLLVACPNRLLLERIAILDDGGDHVCLTSKVISADSDERFVPLRVSAAAHLDPGHGSDERAVRP